MPVDVLVLHSALRCGWFMHGIKKGDRISKVLQEMKLWDRNQCGTTCSGKAISVTYCEWVSEWEREREWVSVCVCVCVYVYSISYPACNVHAPYCHFWHALLCSIFPHLVNTMIFRKKKVIEHKSIFCLPLKLFCETFLILRRMEGDMIKPV
jgi:hypothetical protein